MSVKAKFKIEGLVDYTKSTDRDPAIHVFMSAVTSDSEENKTWSKWTPSGNLELYITNPECFNKFTIGKEYYLTIDEAE